MANEFVARNGIIALNNSQITGSLNVTNGITGSLLGTSSYALTASYAMNAGGATVNTGSLLVTASAVNTTITFTKGDGSTFDVIVSQSGSVSSASYASYALSASNSQTASYINPLNQLVQITGSLSTSGSNILIGNTTLSGSINISGSVSASANMSLGGYLRLDPSIDPGSLNITASYLFTSASNTSTGYDLYYRQDGNLVKFKWLEGGVSTGILYGGIVSASGSTIYVTPGAGIINNMNASTGSEINPIVTYVRWNAYTASATFLTSSQNTYLYIDNTGTVHQQTSYFDQTQYEQAIPLGRVIHANYTTITSYGSNVQTTYDNDNQQNDFIRAFGPIKVEGFTPTGQSGSLRINIGSGTAYNLGGYYPQDPNSPSHYTSTQQLTSSIVRAWRTGSGIYQDNNGGSFYTVIDPTKYDDGTGTLNTVSPGQYTIQRLYFNPVTKRTVVYYGQIVYNSLSTALTNLATDPTTEGEFSSKSLVFIAYLIVKSNTTDLTNTSDAQFIQAGLFRNTAGGSSGGGAIAQTLNDLSDVAITTPTNGQALIYNGVTWINSIPTSSSYAISASYSTNATVANTASYILNAISSSYSVSASNAINANTASYWSGSVLNTTSASYASSSLSASYATNTLNAQTASYVLLAQSASYVLNAVSSAFATTAITSQTASLALRASGSLTGSLLGTATTASYVLNAVSSSYSVTASYVLNAVSSSYATNTNTAATASYVLNAVSSSYALVAQTVLGNITSASYAATASYVLNAISASYAATASIAITASYVLNAVSSSYTPYNGLKTKAGSVVSASFTGNPKKTTVTFSTPFVNNSYSISVVGSDLRSWTIESKVSGSFIINANSNTALTGDTYWVAISHGETN